MKSLIIAALTFSQFAFADNITCYTNSGELVFQAEDVRTHIIDNSRVAVDKLTKTKEGKEYYKYVADLTNLSCVILKD